MGNLVKEMGKEDFEFLKFRALESLEIAEKLFRVVERR